MLFPVQISSFINQAEVQCLFEKQYDQMFFSEPRRNSKVSVRSIPTIQRKYLLKEQPEQLRIQREENKHKNQIASISQVLQKDLGDYRSFSRGFEQLIYDWAIKQYNSGKSVTKQGLRKKANQLGQDRGFKGSARWCESFLKRNGEIKSIIYFNKYCQSKIKERPNMRNDDQNDDKWDPQKQSQLKSSEFNEMEYDNQNQNEDYQSNEYLDEDRVEHLNGFYQNQEDENTIQKIEQNPSESSKKGNSLLKIEFIKKQKK